MENSKRIAVVGTGISGLSAAWLLNQRHEVTVYEQNSYIGGHSNTAEVQIGNQSIPVDTGFIVYNPTNYPNLVAMFDHFNVPTRTSDMSFSASLNNGSLEYSGTNLSGLLAQPSNIIRPRFLRMARDLLRFYKQAPTLINDRSLAGVSLGHFLRANNYSDAFIYDHLMPMGAAIWSSSVQQMLGFPTHAFMRFFDNHGLTQLKDRPEWRTVAGGSREYVDRLTAEFRDRIRVGKPVTQIRRNGISQNIVTADCQQESYDHVALS
jgi:predicted NAD/FAD-binding protein